jgi:hypothetical protein
LNCEERSSFFEGFGEDPAPATGKDVVDAAEDFGCVVLVNEIRKGVGEAYCLLGFRRSTLLRGDEDSSLKILV